MLTEQDWLNRVSQVVEAEMARRGMTYDTLAKGLGDYGITWAPDDLEKTIRSGELSAVLLIQCRDVILGQDHKVAEADILDAL